MSLFENDHEAKMKCDPDPMLFAVIQFTQKTFCEYRPHAGCWGSGMSRTWCLSSVTSSQVNGRGIMTQTETGIRVSSP